MTSAEEVLSANRKAWDHIAETYSGCVLPNWGPFGECSASDLLGSLFGKTVLEIGCGDGRSLSYVVDRGAKRAYGLDFSSAQIARCRKLNREHIENGPVQLLEKAMEEPLDLESVDIVFSVYALGWTLEPKTVFSNLASYLKPGGKLVWSWEHPLFALTKYEEGKLYLQNSYFEETIRCERWCGSDGVYLRTRLISSWFRDLIDSGFTVRNFFEPLPEDISNASADPSRYYSVAKVRNVPATMIFVCEKISS